MSSLVAARRLVGRARVRLAIVAAAEASALGAFVGAALAVLVALVALTTGWLPRPAPPLLLLPLVGALAAAAWSASRAPATDTAALAVDRAAQTGEALLSALTAEDAPAAFRELAAGSGLRAVGSRRMNALLPLSAPRWAAPAALGLGLAAALVLVAPPPASGAAAPQPEQNAAPRAGAGAAGGTTANGGAEGAVAVEDDGTRPGSASVPGSGVGSELRGLTDDALRRLAERLASDGSDSARRALELLATGERAGAERELADALSASGGTSSRPGGLDGAGAPEAGSGTTVPVWSSRHWPLRYDRTVHRWFSRRTRVNDGDVELGERR